MMERFNRFIIPKTIPGTITRLFLVFLISNAGAMAINRQTNNQLDETLSEILPLNPKIFTSPDNQHVAFAHIDEENGLYNIQIMSSSGAIRETYSTNGTIAEVVWQDADTLKFQETLDFDADLDGQIYEHGGSILVPQISHTFDRSIVLAEQTP